MTEHRKQILLIPSLNSFKVFLYAAVLSLGPVMGQTPHRATKLISSLFQTSDRCLACHNSISTASGEDISIGFSWRPTMMANAARDPYWMAGVRRESIEHPESRAAIEDECSICHMPMARYHAKSIGSEGQIFSHIPPDPERDKDRFAADGVSCSLCHQITKDKFGTRESFIGGFVVDTSRPIGERLEYGPFKVDAGRARVMRTSSGGFKPTDSEHVRQSELCATCHTLYTQALGPQGKIVGELPEQMPYQEWLHSQYKNNRSCQSCHMPEIPEAVPISPVFGELRQGVSRHSFVGANFFMPRLLNSYRTEMGVVALPQELNAAAERTIEFLRKDAATLSITGAQLQGGRLEATIAVQNLGGHKFPTAYPSRRLWLHLTIRDQAGRAIFESGTLNPDSSIRGNDNDTDALRFEPHHLEITRPEQVQIYEAIMVNSAGAVTTGLLDAVRYVKDNRLLPRGFDKRSAAKDIAVQGDAAEDPNFGSGGDSIRYIAFVENSAGPFKVEAELWFQPISYRWAQNLRRFDASEPKRFVGYYEAAATGSALLIAHIECAAQTLREP